MTTLTCQKCGQSYQDEPCPPERFQAQVWRLTWKDHCHTCRGRKLETIGEANADAQARKDAQRQRDLEESWAAFAPAMIRATDPARLQREHPEQFKVIDEWQYTPKGLILHGISDQAKTYLAFWLLRRMHFEGRTVAWMDMATLYTTLMSARHAKYGGDAVLLAAWQRADVLLMDDLGKTGIGDDWEELVFGLISRRGLEGLPIIVTTNATGEEMRAAVSNDRRTPMLRRLKQFTDPVPFAKAATPTPA